MNKAVVAASLFAVAAMLAVFGVALFQTWFNDVRGRRALGRQLSAIKRLAVPDDTAAAMMFRSDANEPEWARVLLERLPKLRRVQLLFKQAGLEWSVWKYLVMSVGGAVATGLVLGLLTRSLSVIVVAAIVGSAPTVYAIMRKNRRLAAFEAQLADAIDLLSRALRAGHPLSAGFKLVADESPDPIGVEFRRVFEEQRFGMTVDESLHSLITRVDLLDVRMFVTAMLIQRDVGGNLAEILDGLANTVRTRFTMLAKVRAFTAQARLSGYVLAMLPVALGILLFIVNPPYILSLFQEPLGRVILSVCFGLQVIGYFWIKSIVDIRY